MNIPKDLEKFTAWLVDTYGLVVDSVTPSGKVCLSYGDGFDICNICVDYKYNYNKGKDDIVYSYYSCYNQKQKAKYSGSYYSYQTNRNTRSSNNLGSLKASLKKGDVVPSKNLIHERVKEDLTRGKSMLTNYIERQGTKSSSFTFKSKYDLEEDDLHFLMQFYLNKTTTYEINHTKIVGILNNWESVDEKEMEKKSLLKSFFDSPVHALGINENMQYIYGVVDQFNVENTEFKLLDDLTDYPEMQSIVTMATVRNEAKKKCRGVVLLESEEAYDADLEVVYLPMSDSYIQQDGGIAWMLIK